MSMKQKYKQRGKVTSKITRDGLVERNAATGEDIRISKREADLNLFGETRDGETFSQLGKRPETGGKHKILQPRADDGRTGAIRADAAHVGGSQTDAANKYSVQNDADRLKPVHVSGQQHSTEVTSGAAGVESAAGAAKYPHSNMDTHGNATDAQMSVQPEGCTAGSRFRVDSNSKLDFGRGDDNMRLTPDKTVDSGKIPHSEQDIAADTRGRAWDARGATADVPAGNKATGITGKRTVMEKTANTAQQARTAKTAKTTQAENTAKTAQAENTAQPVQQANGTGGVAGVKEPVQTAQPVQTTQPAQPVQSANETGGAAGVREPARNPMESGPLPDSSFPSAQVNEAIKHEAHSQGVHIRDAPAQEAHAQKAGNGQSKLKPASGETLPNAPETRINRKLGKAQKKADNAVKKLEKAKSIK